MISLNPYLNFDGNCREAMQFYHQCLGGDLALQRFSESPMECSEADKERVMHARISRGDSIVLMASDTMPGHPFKEGNNCTMSLQCDSAAEVDRFFNSLSAGGKVMMAVQETFWAQKFAMFTDKFGIQWMLNLEKAHVASAAK